MENLVEMSFGGIYKGKRVLVTGHTGFKGSWLCEWLLALGAEVHGYALDPLPHERLFGQLNLPLASDTRSDISDRDCLNSRVLDVRPDFLFHLAAQPLVRLSYESPVETFSTNLMGTVHVLEALRLLERSGSSCVGVMVTTDKCYENREWVHSYREEDAMGGHDPYSASKGCAEIAVSSYRRSYFSGNERGIRVASVRAGNVIGGGDWASDRIVPDCIRSLKQGLAIKVRNKTAVRPWQHVLEPLSGYLQLAASIHYSVVNSLPDRIESLCSGFNFGPSNSSNRTVKELVEEILKHWPGEWEDRSDPLEPHEANRLNLAIDKAWHHIGWQPVWNFPATIAKTVDEYQKVDSPDKVEFTNQHIEDYTADAVKAGLRWANDKGTF